MKRTKFLLGGLLLLNCGCSTMSNTDAGLLGGGAIGAGIGTVLGAATGHPGVGAAIGAATGAVAGGAIGANEDRQERQVAAAVAQANSRPGMTIQDVVSMSQSHAGDSVIITAIRNSNSGYNLTSSDIIWLRQQGVSEPVVNEMISRRPAVVVPGGPPPGAVYVDPYYGPPPVAVGIGYGWYGPRRYYRGW